MAPSIVDVKDVEPVKKSSHGKVVENNIVHAAEFHRGKDGVLRQLCGPRIALVFERHKVCVYNQRPRSDADQEPEPEEVQPTFRTPSGWVKIGAILIAIKQGVHDHMQSEKRHACLRKGHGSWLFNGQATA